MVDDVKSLVSIRVGDVLEGRNGYRSLVADLYTVREFDAPMGVKLSYDRQPSGKINPFVSYDGKEWFKLTQNLVNTKTAEAFQVIAPGYYSAVIAPVGTEGLAEGSAEKAELEKVASRFDLSDIFSGMDTGFRPSLPVLNREAVLLYERVLEREGETFGMNLNQKIAALGLGSVVRAGAQNGQMERQRAAALLASMYAALKGVASLEASTAYLFADAASVDGLYRKAVDLCLEKGFLTRSGGNVEPGRAVTRGEVLHALAIMLEG
jgi:hypothetical protein